MGKQRRSGQLGAIDPKHVGSSFEDWLREEGFHDLLMKGKATDRCLSVSAAAKAIGIPRSHLVDLIERAQIECHRDGRSMRVMASECMRYKAHLKFKSKGGVMALWGSMPTVNSGRRGRITRADIYRDIEWADR